jgi:thioesterase domain-containing protein
MTLVEFRKIFDIFKINANTMDAYRPREYRGKIALFTPAQDTTIDLYIFRNMPSDNVEPEPDTNVGDGDAMPARDPFKGWRKLATGGIDLHLVPGDHFSMMREPHVSVLAEQLRLCIETRMRELQT